MEHELKINRLKDYGLIYAMMASNSIAMGDVVTIDLTDHLFFKPVHVILLTMGIIQLVHSTGEVIVVPPINESHNRFLMDIEFENFCQSNLHKSKTMGEIASKTAMPIKRLSLEYLNSYTLDVLKYLGTKCEGKDTSMLNISIAELINNVYDHAGSETGGSPIDAYIFSQYNSEKRQISIVVGDFGIGIPEKANKYFAEEGLPLRSNADCIKWALELNESSFSQPHNRGKGLNNIYSFVKSSGSHLRIFSNDVMLDSGNAGDKYGKNPIEDFRGTVVEVEINIDGLAIDDETTLTSMWD